MWKYSWLVLANLAAAAVLAGVGLYVRNKPGMSAKETERWTRKRTTGRWRFILFYGVLLFGGLSLALCAAVTWLVSREIFELEFLSHPVPVLSAFALMSALWGLLMWETMEFRFRRASRPLSGDC